MPPQQTTPTPLLYETPKLRPPWYQSPHATTAGWAVALSLYPAFLFFLDRMWRRTSGSTDPHILSLQWAAAAIAVRATLALLTRNRTWWSLLYIALYFILPFLTNSVASWWRHR